MHRIAFVCVDYNGWEYTRKFLASLEHQRGRGVEFMLGCVVVDNSTDAACSDNLRASVAGLDWVTYRHAQKNAGYFGGLNLGLVDLRLDEWDYVVVCNNDLEFEEDFCRKLISRQYGSEVFSICPDVVTADGYHQNPHVLKPISWLRRLQFDFYFSHYYVARALTAVLRIVRPGKSSPLQPPESCEIHMGIGACYILTREFLQRFGALDYPHFLYGEEAFISHQIHTAGGILLYDPDLLVHHAESAATSKVPKRATYEFARQGYSEYRKML
ncbi:MULTISPECIES: glycosyltransferase family 2 protein [Cupriavidus]